jgi:hypothetical protein
MIRRLLPAHRFLKRNASSCPCGEDCTCRDEAGQCTCGETCNCPLPETEVERSAARAAAAAAYARTHGSLAQAAQAPTQFAGQGANIYSSWTPIELLTQQYTTRKKDDESHVWTFDIDDTLTSAPLQFARLATALRAMGDKVVIVTGHGPEATRKELLDAIGFPYDSIVITDPKDGSGKAKVIKKLGGWFHFDDRIDFGPEIIKVCPLSLMYVEPPGDSNPKKDAEQAQEDLDK